MISLANRALIFATEAHCSIDQRRKYTGEPYIVHPIDVAEIVKIVGHTEEMIAAAYCHDVIEDVPGYTRERIESELGGVVATLVWWLTDKSKPNDGNRAARKEIDRQHLANAPGMAQTIKCADLISNTKSIKLRDPDFWRVYRGEKIALLKVMHDGDPLLWQLAWDLCHDA